MFAGALAPVLTDQTISSLSLVGSVLIFCVGVNLAFDKKFRVGEYAASIGICGDLQCDSLNNIV